MTTLKTILLDAINQDLDSNTYDNLSYIADPIKGAAKLVFAIKRLVRKGN